MLPLIAPQLLGTQVVETTVTAWISKVLGEAEITEQQENLSYGAHSIRDGVSLSPQTRTKPLILPTEIANLRDLEAYIKLPGPYPVCRTKLTYKNLPIRTESFTPVPEDELKQRGVSLDNFITSKASQPSQMLEQEKPSPPQSLKSTVTQPQNPLPPPPPQPKETLQ